MPTSDTGDFSMGRLSFAIGAVALVAISPLAFAQETAPDPAADAVAEAPAEPGGLSSATEPVDGVALPPCPEVLDPVTGEVVLDDTGAPTFMDGMMPRLDADGEPLIGEDGSPLTEACKVPAAEAVGDEDELTDPAETDTAHTPGGPFAPIMRLLAVGGPIIAILAVLAVLTIGVGLVKIIQFVWLGVGRSGFVRSVVDGLRDGATGGAADELDQRRNPVARVMAAAVRGKANADMSDTLVREETTRVAQAQLDGLERGLALLSLVATIAPLLGLLGTVLGMIEAFQQMETVGDRVEPAVLAGGIWEALLTTAAGLSVAIPAAVLFTWLQRAVDVEAQRMEDAATQVFTLPLYDGLKPVAA